MTKEEFDNLLIVHNHWVERLKNNLSLKYLQMTLEADKKIKEFIEQFENKELTNAVRKQLIAGINKIENDYWSRIEPELRAELEQFIQYEVTWNNVNYQDLFTMLAMFDAVSADRIRRGVFDTPFLVGKNKASTINRLIQGLTDYRKQVYQTNIDRAFVLQNSISELRKTLFGVLPIEWNWQNKNTPYEVKNAQIQLTRNFGSNALRTSLGFVQSYIHKTFYQINRELFDGYTWNAILDTKTCLVCINLDGKFYYFNNPELSTLEQEIYPPAHMECRCFTQPILKGQSAPERKTYPEWFNNRSTEFQKEVLGAYRYEQFKSGKFSLKDYVSLNDMAILTIAELKKQDRRFRGER